MQNTFDYIVVGSGAAGSVLAERLTASGRATVCVIEAGPPDSNPFIKLPAGYVKNLNNPELVWQFRSSPSEGTAGREVYIPQGKVLGGSTSVNGLVYNRGQVADFDNWAAMGATGWAYSDVLEYFKRSENRAGGDPCYRGQRGPLDITPIGQSNAICDAFIDAVASFGLPKHNDYNGRTQRGAGYNERFIDQRARRVTAASTYLKQAQRRAHLNLITNAQVTRVIIEGGRAVGVEYVHDKGAQPVSIRARREVILSAGTVNSTKLLQLSGIGDSVRLKNLGIQPVHHLLGVGENFQDHYFMRFSLRVRKGYPSLNQQVKGWRLLTEMIRWFAGKPGALSICPSVAYAFINSQTFEADPDLQFIFAHGSYKPGKVYVLDDFPGMTCGFTQQRPHSIGYIHIRSSDPFEAPVIQPNYLQHEVDRAVVIRAMRLTRQILQSPKLASIVDEELVPGANVQSDDELLNFAKETGNTGYHLVGTNRMGQASDPMTVVGPDLKLHGLDGLRVIDASVMPRVTSANTCAATYMIAEKGADLVLGEHSSG
jgi:choline dehydrogenase